MESEEEVVLKLTDEENISYTWNEIARVLVDEPDPLKLVKMIPSVYIKQMSMNLEERYKHVINPLRRCTSLKPNNWTPPEQTKCLTLEPNILVIQGWNENKKYHFNIKITNTSKTMVFMKIVSPDTNNHQCFTIKFCSKTGTRLAPGLSATIIVYFEAPDQRDFFGLIKILTKSDDTGIIFIPLIALAPRAMFDLPDCVYLPETPVKNEIFKSLMVRNLSTAGTHFKFEISEPFRVDPIEGIIEGKEIIQLNIYFHSSSIGTFERDLILNYDSGEIIQVQCFGSAFEAPIHLSRKSIIIEDTYFTLNRLKTFELINNSNHIITFSWRKYPSHEKENEIYKNLEEAYKEIRDIESCKSNLVEYKNIVSNQQVHRDIYNRIYNDEVKLLYNEKFIFHNTHFEINPKNGEVWPHSKLELNIIFTPDSAKKFNAEAYLEVTGLQQRLPLEIQAKGIGPRIKLNVETLDIDYIFLCSVHHYEIVASNEGDIIGTLSFVETELKFGGRVHCFPTSVTLNPRQYKSFTISFSSNQQGSFIEEISFIINESHEKVILMLKGKIISPTLHFSVKFVDFGKAPIGFSIRKKFELENLSLVPVAFSLRVLQDGTEKAITYSHFENQQNKLPLPLTPKEFTIKPKDGIVEAHSKLEVKLDLIANIERDWKTYLMVDMWDSKSESVYLEIRYNSSYPEIICKPEELIVRFCFLNYPYNRVITLHNISDVPGFFYLLPQKENINTAGMSYTAQVTQGVINAKENKQIAISIMAHKIGRQSLKLRLLILGQCRPQTCCMLGCNGQGAVISLSPSELIWGSTEILKKKSLFLTLTNDSPIPAIFTISLPQRSPWTVKPHEGVIKPEEAFEVTVTIFLRDSGRYRDSLSIEVKDSRVIKVDLFAIGVGSSIIIEPNIAPTYNFGQLFSDQVFRIPFKITNRGSRVHQLLWSINKDLKNFSRAIVDMTPENVFQVVPNKILLGPNESMEFHVEGIYNKVGILTEEIFLHGLIDNRLKHLIFSSVLSAEFIIPKLLFSRSEIIFRCDVIPGMKMEFLRATIGLTNMSTLDLNFDLEIDYPFSFIDGKGYFLGQLTERELSGKKGTLIHLQMDPMFKLNRYSRIARGSIRVKYKDHPHKEFVSITGEVNFPNLTMCPNNKIDFETVSLGMNVTKDIIITNYSPMKTRFFWFFAADTVNVEYFNENSCDQLTIDVDGLENENQSIEDENKRISAQKQIDKDRIKEKLFPIYQCYFEQEINSFLFEILPKEANKVKDIAQIYDIVPFYGILEPLQSRKIHFTFNAFTYFKASVKAICLVEGGPTESLMIHGISAKLSYSISNTRINFGRVNFSEFCQKSITIENTNILGFKFLFSRVDKKPIIGNMNRKTSIIEFFHSNKMFMSKGLLQIDNKKGFLDGHQSIDIQLRYMPGLIGPFELKVFLEIGHNEPIILELSGFAGFPQIYLHLPRPNSQDLDINLQYNSARALEVYCEAGLTDESQRKNTSMTYIHGEGYKNKNLNQLEIDEIIEDVNYNDFDNPDEWVVINYEDPKNYFPQLLEFELSLERELLIKHIRFNPNIFITIAKNRTIQKFIVPSYLIDLGFVITDTPASYTATGINMSPNSVRLTINQSYGNLSENNISLYFHHLALIAPGSTFSITVTFHPTLEKFPELQHHIEDIFHIEVLGGAKIPVNIRAIVTRPYIILQEQSVNFGKVKSGQCCLQVIHVINDGLIPCTWTPAISSKIYRKRCVKTYPTYIKDNSKITYQVSVDDSPFILTSQPTTYQPRECGYIELYYKPIKSIRMDYSELIIAIENIREKIRIPVSGEAIEPVLYISANKIDFGSVLPYEEDEFRIFEIKNPLTLPIEIYFPQYDKQYQDEKNILNLLFLYYKTEELLIPVRNPGERFPFEILSFYNKAKDALRKKLFEDKEILASSPKTMKKTKLDSPNKPIIDPLIDLSNSEINTLLVDLLEDEKNRVYFDHVNPLQEAIESRIAELYPVDEGKPNPGLVIIFNSPPLTDSIQYAWKMARSLNMVPLNIDNLIKQSLSKPNSLSSLKAFDLFSAEFKTSWNTTDSEDVSDNIERILNNLTKSPLKSEGTLANIPLNLFEHIIRQRLANEDCSGGVIFDSLKSRFIPNSIDVLTTILAAAGNIKFLHCFTFYNTLENYKKWKNEMIHEEERTREIEYRKRMKAFRLLSESELHHLSQEDKILYEQFLLENRKRYRYKKNSKNESMVKNRLSPDEINKMRSLESTLNQTIRKFKEKEDNLFSLNNDVKDDFLHFEASLPKINKILEIWEPCKRRFSISRMERRRSRRRGSIRSSRKSLTSSYQESLGNNIGIPHWIIDSRNPNPEWMQYILNQFCQIEEIFSSLPKKQCHLLEQKENLNFLVATPKTNIPFLHNCHFSFCNIFYDQCDSDIQLEKKKSMYSSNYGLRRINEVDPNRNTIDITQTACGNLLTRCILEPSQSIKLRVSFLSQEPGYYSEEFLVSVTDYARPSIITINANVEIPQVDLNPTSVFEKVIEDEEIDINNKISLVFVTNTKYFEYGAALMTKPKEKPFHQTVTIFSFHNISNLLVEQHFFFKYKHEEGFLLDTDVLLIPRNEKKFLSVSATPRNLGRCETTLYFSIKNNPNVYSIKLRCYGIKPEFAVDPKVLNFDHVLLYNNSTHFLNFTNKSTVTLFWKFENLQEFQDNFDFSQIENEIAPQETQVIHIGYESNKEHMMKDVPLFIEVFVNKIAGEPVLTEKIFISAEAFDIKIDIGFENLASHLDFGSRKVTIPHTLPIFLKNHGAYDSVFRITTDYLKEDVENDFLINYIKFIPTNGVIKKDKLSIIKVTFHPIQSLNIREVPCLWIKLFDIFNPQKVIAEIPINMSIHALSSSFKILPYPILDFGSMSINEESQLEINIDNTGIFPFTFTIAMSNLKSIVPISLSKIEKFKSDSNKKLKDFEKSLIVGPFQITPSEGVIEPGESSKLVVNCQSSSAEDFNLDCNIIVSECIEHSKNILTLTANICKPFIDFEDLYSIFKEVNIIKDVKNFLNFKLDFSGATYYEDHNTLYFHNVCIGDTETAPLHFVNDVRVPCEIQFSLNGDNSAFSINHERFIIESHSFKILHLAFKPTGLKVYKGSFKAIHADKNNKYGEMDFKIEGRGYLPEVIISKPNLEEESIIFPNTLVGRFNGQKFNIKNVSNIPCRVILEFINNEDNAFEIWPCASTLQNIIHSEKIEKPIPFNRMLVISLKAWKEEKFGICFRPGVAKDLFRTEIVCTILNNPYEFMKRILIGRSFEEDLVLDGLQNEKFEPDFNPDFEYDNFFVEANLESGKMYNIDLGIHEIGIPIHRNIMLSNISKKKIYRYEWIYQDNRLEIEPLIGHLSPNTSANLQITFVSIEPTKFQEVIQCQTNEILIDNENDNEMEKTNWNIKQSEMEYLDEEVEVQESVGIDILEENPHSNKHQTFCLTNPLCKTQNENYDCTKEKETMIKRKKNIIPIPEPSFRIILQTEKILKLNLHVQTMYNSVEYETSEIVFKDTLLFQHCEYLLSFTNTSPLNLRYQWEIEDCRGRYVDRSKNISRPKSQKSIIEEKYVTPEGNIRLKCRRYKPIICADCNDEIAHNEESICSLTETNLLEPLQPFSIDPLTGIVPPNSECKTKIVFSPLDTIDFRTQLRLTCLNMSPDIGGINFHLRGKGLMPYCHFDIETSDYLTSGRGNFRNVKCDVNKIKVIEFNNIGLYSFQKKFYIYNPTDESWDFSWKTDYPDKPKFFCHPNRGTIESGKRSLCEITFVPDQYNEFKELFTFCICKHNIVELILLVGFCFQPKQYFLHSNISLPPVLLGSTTHGHATLVNDESQIMNFAFEPTIPQIVITPMRGTIEGNSEKQIRIDFEPLMKGDKSYRIACVAKGHLSPIYLSVLTVCHKVRPIISLVTPNNRVYSLDPYQPNILNLEKVLRNKAQLITFNLTNVGRIAFKFNFRFNQEILEKNNIRIKCSERGGIITPEARACCLFSITFLSVTTINDFEILLEISRGPRYLVLMSATSFVPQFKFSFSNYDFGACLIDKDNSSLSTANLEFTNLEDEPAIIDNIFENLPYLKVEAPTKPIEPNGTVVIPIIFSPLDKVDYSEKITFLINGQNQYSVKITGRGDSLKVIPLISEKIIKFGIVKKNTQVTKTIQIRNYNDICVNAKFWVAYTTEEDTTPAIKSFTVIPSEVVINKLTTIKLSIIFNPQQRLTPFNLRILSKYTGNRPEPLFFVQGSCADYEFSLDRSTIPFGSVIINTITSQNIVLSNTGDLGSSFRLKTDQLPNSVKIVPTHGFISQGMSIIFNFTFAPKIVESFRLYTVLLYIDDYHNSPIKITVSTKSVCLPEPSQILEFQCPVRQKQTLQLVLENKSQGLWQLKPTFTGQVFTGPEFVTIDPNSTLDYPITYSPIYMTNEDTMNKEMLLFSFDEGSVLIYGLVGSAKPPLCEEYIVREIPCKTSYIELFTLNNWLNIGQRLRFAADLEKTEQFDPIIILSCPEFIDVPVNKSRQYRCYFYIFKPCKLQYKIQFTDISTNEYMFFNLELNVTPCAPLDTIVISTVTFTPKTFYIKLNNMLTKMEQLKDRIELPLVYQFSLTFNEKSLPMDALRFPTEPILVNDEDVNVPCTWIPVAEGEWTAIVDAFNPELGSFPYRLQLTATIPPPNQSIQISVPLGSIETCIQEIDNFTLHKAVFNCQVDNPDFTVKETLNVAPSSRIRVELNFEPSEIGSITALLTIRSPTAGKFLFPIAATGLPPEIQGPFIVKYSKPPLKLKFKNIFKQTQIFIFRVKPAKCFEILTSQEIKIKSKMETYIEITVARHEKENLDKLFPDAGKLTVFCRDPTLSNIVWTYYLKAEK